MLKNRSQSITVLYYSVTMRIQYHAYRKLLTILCVYTTAKMYVTIVYYYLYLSSEVYIMRCIYMIGCIGTRLGSYSTDIVKRT